MPNDPRAQYAFSRCWVDIDVVVRRLREIRAQHSSISGAPLNKAYVSTNGEKEWVERLKGALIDDGWAEVYTTKDLELSWRESGVDGAIGKILFSLAFYSGAAR